jgi:small-conductance mechanosensitive channel
MDAVQPYLQDLTDLTAASWVRDLALLVAVLFVSWLPARALRAPLRRRREGRTPTGPAAFLWLVIEESVLPALAALLMVVGDAVVAALRPTWTVRLAELLPVVGFLLLWRVGNACILRYMARSPRRRRLRRVLLPLLFVLAVLQQLGLLGPVLNWLGRPLVSLGSGSISLLGILGAILLVIVVLLFAQGLGQLLGRRVLPGMGLDAPLSEALGTVVRYAVVAAGILIALDTLGLDLSTLQIGLGALGVGIGFGLQNIVQNFMSGLILLFERTVKRGDIVQVNGVDARVLRIGLRSSVVRTRQGHEVVVPNSDLVVNPVVNYSLSDSYVRLDVPVGVSYRSEPRRVEGILLEAAGEHDLVLRDPGPSVLFMGYGESSIDFELRCWLDGEWPAPTVRSDLLFAIWYKLKDAGIEIPFPQRDLHLRSSEVDLGRGGATSPADSSPS